MARTRWVMVIAGALHVGTACAPNDDLAGSRGITDPAGAAGATGAAGAGDDAGPIDAMDAAGSPGAGETGNASAGAAVPAPVPGTWQQRPAGGHGKLNALLPDGDVVLAAFGANDATGTMRKGGVLRSADDGATWTAAALPATTGVGPGQEHMVTSLASDGTRVFAGSGSGGLLVSGDHGKTFARAMQQPLDLLSPIIEAVGIVGDKVYAGGATGWVALTTGPDGFWQIVEAEPDLMTPVRVFFDTAASPKSWIGFKGGLSVSTTRGLVWTNARATAKGLETPTDFVALALAGTALFLATDDGLYQSSDGGATWTRSAGVAGPVSAVLVAKGHVFAAGAGAAPVQISDDGGKTWAPFGAGLPGPVRRLGATATMLLAGEASDVWRTPLP
jgi:hypothetical protein